MDMQAAVAAELMAVPWRGSLGGAKLRQGTVVSYDQTTETCSLYLGGDTDTQIDGVPVLNGLLLVANDAVWLTQNGSDLIVVGTRGPRAWPTWSPTYAGWSIGNAVVVSKYTQTGRLTTAKFSAVMGSTTTFSGTMLVSLPVPPAADYIQLVALGAASFLDASVGSTSRRGGTAVHSSGSVFFLSDDITGAQTVTNLVPWTWTTSDVLTFTAVYESA